MMPHLLVAIPFALGPCVLDMAVVTHVPPATAHVIVVSECGGVRCWHRYVETGGRRIGETRICTGENGKLEVVPPQ
jgi:hypothetical protein